MLDLSKYSLEDLDIMYLNLVREKSTDPLKDQIKEEIKKRVLNK